MAHTLFGGWLGFHATTGLLAVLATIVGAAITANLMLIIWSIAWARPRPLGDERQLGDSGPDLMRSGSSKAVVPEKQRKTA